MFLRIAPKSIGGKLPDPGFYARKSADGKPSRGIPPAAAAGLGALALLLVWEFAARSMARDRAALSCPGGPDRQRSSSPPPGSWRPSRLPSCAAWPPSGYPWPWEARSAWPAASRRSSPPPWPPP
ncbi:MAG: hypothetical protein M0C28_22095 [Candidatus Moduliflexus flocculans]|nr:hypothetical protein [Candidatus Moduliflexus flocculans]